MTKVEVISSCLVGSNITQISRLDLTAWDLTSFLINPIQRGILFHKPQSQKIDHNFILHLKNSLSRTLDFFPPLAGRLATIPNDDNTACYFVDCNNAGAEFVHAVAGDISISDILEPKFVPQEIVSSFFRLNRVANFEGTSKPLLGVQVTELADGLFIACSANHGVIDGTSFWHFFNSWSEISRGFDTISKSPVFERWFPSNSNSNRLIPLPPLEKNMPRNYTPGTVVERVFQFSKESIAKLKAKANSEAETDKISSLLALCAHLWRSCTRCRRCADDPITQEVGFMMSIGARGRIPLPEGYFGNAAIVARTGVNESELLQKGLGYAALKINELVAQHTKERMIKLVEDWMKNPVLLGKTGNFPFFVTSSPWHNVYGTDFGWGKPIAVRSGRATIFDGIMSTFPATVDGGIEVHACLKLETLQAMEDDAEFMEAFTL
ncbi:hypothetical protein ACS0TY_034551 [Phlomoides rotata]